MLIYIAIAVAVVLMGLLGFAATRPGSFQIHRSIAIQAPPTRLFDLIADFRNWSLWSPYEKYDPAMKKSMTGAPSGKGAVYAWAGNSKAGEGRMEILDAAPASHVSIKLDFLKPFEGHNTAEFTLEPQGSATRVTWAMFGPQNFMLKLMSIFVNMDSMIGKDFEEGLRNMKAAAESAAAHS
jgi:uncharacterized protein YndB with AHSA1/START domain